MSELASETPVDPDVGVGACLLGLSIVLRFGLAMHTDLYFDEAYYLAWAQHPALGYFDHPPMVAWLLSVFPPRGMGIFFGVLSDLAVVRLGEAAGLTRGKALLAAAAFALIPLNIILGTLALPDAALLFFGTVALTALLRERWKMAAFALGLAMLSKVTAVLLVPAAVVALAEKKAWRALAPGALITLAVFSPFVIWNVQHAFVSFAFQLHHGLGGAAGLPSAAKYLGAQLGVTLLLAAFAVAGFWQNKRVLAVAAAVPLGAFLLASLRSPGEANWPALAYPALAVLAVMRFPRAIRGWLGVASLVAIAGVAVLTVPGKWTPLLSTPLSRLHGWAVLAHVKETEPVAVFADSYELASEVQAYTQLPVTVAGPARASQFTLWPRPNLEAGANVLWIDERGNPPPVALRELFEEVRPEPDLLSPYGGEILHRFHRTTLVKRKP